MALGLVGKKLGMTRVYNDEGQSIPVTVLQIVANRVTQIKTIESDGYNAAQLTYGTKKSNKLNKSETGHFAKAGVEAGNGLIEFHVDSVADIKIGSFFDVSLFKEGQKVDVTSRSKGKGFSGNIKRHNFSSQRASHGNSLSHKAPGSIGQCQDPGRVFKGKKMAGQLGNKKVTVQNLEIVKVDLERNLVLIKGAIPGSVDTPVVVCSSVKVGA